MNYLIQLLGEQWLIGVLQILLGGLIKPQLKDKLLAMGLKATAFIPIINLLIAYLGFQLLPASASAAMFIGVAVPVKEGLAVLAAAVLQTVMVTGTFSTWKNTVLPVAKVMVQWLFSKIASK